MMKADGKESNDSCLCLFLKSPVTGRVKTRLAREVGERRACELYRCFVADTIGLSLIAGYPTILFFDPPDAREAMARWLGKGFVYKAQQGIDLGERMYRALETALEERRSAVLIGTDIPGLPPGLLDEAFRSLENRDAVIGPARDGGYYLIGFSAGHLLRAVFDRVPWGSGRVFEATMAAFEKHRLGVHLLPTFTDIDRYDDLKEFFLARAHLPPGKLSTVDYLRRHYKW